MTNSFRRNRYFPMPPFQASLMQCRRAWETYFGGPLPKHLAYRDAALMIVESFGYVAGKAFIQAQSNTADFLPTDFLPYEHPANLWHVQTTRNV